jgi:hypothetical protein
MSGAIGLIAPDTSRYTMFWISFNSLERPVNTMPAWSITSDRILGRNSCVEQALDMGAEWLFFVDDDHVFGPRLLKRLLSHNVPVVGALYLQRQMPFLPIAYSHKDENNIYHNVDLHNHGPDDLIEVAAVGTGGMLIRSEVLRAMEKPWFEHGRASEDLIFCDAVYELGLGPVYCDLGARMGHIQPAALWPTHDGEGWQAGFAMADGFSVTVEMPKEITTG